MTVLASKNNLVKHKARLAIGNFQDSERVKAVIAAFFIEQDSVEAFSDYCTQGESSNSGFLKVSMSKKGTLMSNVETYCTNLRISLPMTKFVPYKVSVIITP